MYSNKAKNKQTIIPSAPYQRWLEFEAGREVAWGGRLGALTHYRTTCPKTQVPHVNFERVRKNRDAWQPYDKHVPEKKKRKKSWVSSNCTHRTDCHRSPPSHHHITIPSPLFPRNAILNHRMTNAARYYNISIYFGNTAYTADKCFHEKDYCRGGSGIHFVVSGGCENV